MKKLLILLSIFFLLSNSNIKSAGRSDAAAVATESKEEKEKTGVGRSPSFSVKDDKVMKEIASAYLHIPAGISGIILDYCKSKFEPAYKFSAHASWIYSLIALDDTHFASSSVYGVIKIWQYIRSTADAAEKYECIQVLDHASDSHTDLVISLIKFDDTHFISGSKDRTIKIWQLIPSASSTSAQYRCIKTLDLNNDGHEHWVNSLAKLDDNHFVSGFSDGIIKIWEFIPSTSSTLAQCRYIQTFDENNGGHRDLVASLMIFDDTHFVSGSWDSSIKIWELNPETSTARCIQALNQNDDGHEHGVNLLAKLDKTHFVSGFSDGIIKIWEYDSLTDSVPKCIQTLDHRNDGHTDSVNSLIKLDDNHFVSSSLDKKIKIWEFIPATASTPATCACIQKFTTDKFVFSLTRMSNGDLIAGLGNGVIQIFKPVVDIE